MGFAGTTAATVQIIVGIILAVLAAIELGSCISAQPSRRHTADERRNGDQNAAPAFAEAERH
jgi:hypothetical protein